MRNVDLSYFASVDFLSQSFVRLCAMSSGLYSARKTHRESEREVEVTQHARKKGGRGCMRERGLARSAAAAATDGGFVMPKATRAAAAAKAKRGRGARLSFLPQRAASSKDEGKERERERVQEPNVLHFQRLRPSL